MSSVLPLIHSTNTAQRLPGGVLGRSLPGKGEWVIDVWSPLICGKFALRPSPEVQNETKPFIACVLFPVYLDGLMTIFSECLSFKKNLLW